MRIEPSRGRKKKFGNSRAGSARRFNFVADSKRTLIKYEFQDGGCNPMNIRVPSITFIKNISQPGDVSLTNTRYGQSLFFEWKNVSKYQIGDFGRKKIGKISVKANRSEAETVSHGNSSSIMDLNSVSGGRLKWYRVRQTSNAWLGPLIKLCHSDDSCRAWQQR